MGIVFTNCLYSSTGKLFGVGDEFYNLYFHWTVLNIQHIAVHELYDKEKF